MSAIVRCSACHQRSRVAVESLGLLVACPRCGNPFVAESDDELIILPDAPVATVHPRRRTDTPRLPLPDDPPHPHHVGPNGPLISVALLPLGIPLLWLLVSAATGRETVLSYAAPLAIAVGICGLCAGIALTHWSTAARIRAMLALVMLAYLAAGSLYFLKQNWLEDARQKFFRAEGEWRDFKPPDESYRVQFPGPPVPQEGSPLESWPLKTFRYSDPKRGGSDVFVVAHGIAPKEFSREVPEELWFKELQALVVTPSAGGVTIATERSEKHPDWQVRRYEFQLPDSQLKRVVRIVRVGGRVFYLRVEGPFLTGETPDVKQFLNSFTILPAKS